MQTDDLIRSLSREVRPVPPWAVERRLTLGLIGGAIGTFVLVVFGLGLRPDLASAIGRFPFWMKLCYTVTLAIGAVAATVRLARPDAPPLRGLRLLVVPVGLMGGIAIVQLADAPVQFWGGMWLGHSARECSFLVLGLSAPIFLGLIWAFRRFAPTRLSSAGGAAGFASGAVAATVYCLHCPEASASFVLTWYSLGIALAALTGRIVGPRLLRW